jgi:integrative and conjugative element protein (TIGR02256 family)
MQLLVTRPVIERLERELRRAGRKEIGGLLMGEHVQDELFRLVELSVQQRGGTSACFIRRPEDHKEQLEKFFAETGNDFRRFNYMGEWHSHPSFEPLPSDTDVRTMQSMVEDSDAGVNFLVLIVCRMAAGRVRVLELTATAFRAGAPPLVVPISVEAEPVGQTKPWSRASGDSCVSGSVTGKREAMRRL